MQWRGRHVPVIAMVAIGAGLFGAWHKACGAPTQTDPKATDYQTKAYIALTDAKARTGLFEFQESPAGWRLIGALTGSDGVLHHVELREGADAFLKGAAAGAPIDLKTTTGKNGLVAHATFGSNQEETVIVIPGSDLLGGTGAPPVTASFWETVREALERLRRILEELANFCVNQATSTCGQGNVCSVSSSAGPDGVSCSFTCCGPQQNEQE